MKRKEKIQKHLHSIQMIFFFQLTIRIILKCAFLPEYCTHFLHVTCKLQNLRKVFQARLLIDFLGGKDKGIIR